jgi:hypothetical protein
MRHQLSGLQIDRHRECNAKCSASAFNFEREQVATASDKIIAFKADFSTNLTTPFSMP